MAKKKATAKVKRPAKKPSTAFDFIVKTALVAGPQTTLIAIRMPVGGTAVLPLAASTPLLVHVEVERLVPASVDEIWAIIHPAGTTPTPPALAADLLGAGYTKLDPLRGEIFGKDVACPTAVTADSS